MTVPKRRCSHSRTARRWAGYRKPKTPGMVTCPNCQELMQSHRICASCGYYKGREVIKAEEE